MNDGTPSGWVPAAMSLVAVYDGHRSGLLRPRAEIEKFLGASVARTDLVGGQHQTVDAWIAPTGISARLEYSNQPQQRTRLLARHEGPIGTDVEVVSQLVTFLVQKKGLPKPRQFGINFSRLLFDGPGQPLVKFLESVSRDSGLTEILGGRSIRAGQIVLTGNRPRGVRVQLKFVEVESRTPVHVGTVRGVIADINYSVETPTKESLLEAASVSSIRSYSNDFERCMKRLLTRVRTDD